MDIKQLREEIIKPVLEMLDLYSKNAENLLLGTACQESHAGEYVRQLGCKGNVGAFGIYQMELATHNDIWDNFLKYNKPIADKIKMLRIKELSDSENLLFNLAYATAMCRVHYYRISEKIPDNIYGQAQYWKKYYNTEFGKGTIEEYQQNWNRLVK